MSGLLERDIEDALYAAPEQFPEIDHTYHVKKWLARQYPVPSGRIDLLGLLDNRFSDETSLVVVEVKRGRLDANAIAQVCRYAADIEAIADEVGGRYGSLTVWHKVIKVLVGQDIDLDTLLAAQGLNIATLKYQLTHSISISGGWELTPEAIQSRHLKIKQLAEDSPFEAWVREAKEIGATWGKQWEQ